MTGVKTCAKLWLLEQPSRAVCVVQQFGGGEIIGFRVVFKQGFKSTGFDRQFDAADAGLQVKASLHP